MKDCRAFKTSGGNDAEGDGDPTTDGAEGAAVVATGTVAGAATAVGTAAAAAAAAAVAAGAGTVAVVVAEAFSFCRSSASLLAAALAKDSSYFLVASIIFSGATLLGSSGTIEPVSDTVAGFKGARSPFAALSAA